MDFILFDKYLNQYPKQINKLIYYFYKDNCDKCGIKQQYCYICKLYKCECMEDIYHCNVEECNKLLCHHIRIKINNVSQYLCQRCWNIDIYDDILEDIRMNCNNDA